MGDDNDQDFEGDLLVEWDPNCEHIGVECELPCTCRCNDCIGNEDEDDYDEDGE